MVIKVESENIRVDKYLKDYIDLSRETIIKMINDGYVLVNDKNVKPSYQVKLNDVITVKDGYVKPMELEAQKMDLDIVYEDKYLMVINKPSGLVVHPGNGNHDKTMVNGLLYYTNNLSDDDVRPGIVHRLDKDTSGLMLVAKDNKCHELLADDFKHKRIHREYIALVEGVFPQEEAIIDAPIARSKDTFFKMAVDSKGKRAVTHVKVIKRYKDYTLLNLVLETGRTHQIRVHLAYIGYPVFNDPVYSKKKATEFGQFLHSCYLKFKHPITGEVLEFREDVPKEFREFLDNLEDK